MEGRRDLTHLFACGPRGEQDEGGRGPECEKEKSHQWRGTTLCLHLPGAPACQMGPARDRALSPGHGPCLALTGKDVLVAILGQVSSLCSSFRGYRSRHSCCCSIWLGEVARRHQPVVPPFPEPLVTILPPLSLSPLLALAQAPKDGSLWRRGGHLKFFPEALLGLPAGISGSADLLHSALDACGVDPCGFEGLARRALRPHLAGSSRPQGQTPHCFPEATLPQHCLAPSSLVPWSLGPSPPQGQSSLWIPRVTCLPAYLLELHHRP